MPGARNVGLDAARAGAILLVLFNHLVFNILSPPVGLWWYTAYLGVDVFFALSGFLIGGILIQLCMQAGTLRIAALKHFLTRRALRTWPLYFVMLAANFLLSQHLLHRSARVNYTYFFFLQSFTRPPAGFYGETWSLCVEEWFYFSFAAGLWLFLTISKRSRLAIQYKMLLFALLYIALFSCIRLLISTYDYNDVNITIYRLDAIAYGVLAALFDRFYKKPLNYYTIGAVGFVISIIGMAILLWHSKTGNYYILYYNVTGVGLAISVLFCKRYSFYELPGFIKTVVTYISKTSYSLYLANLPVTYALAVLLPLPMHGWPQFFISIACIAGLSYITYRFIEQPFLRLSKKHAQVLGVGIRH